MMHQRLYQRGDDNTVALALGKDAERMQYHQKCDIVAVSPRLRRKFLTVANELQTAENSVKACNIEERLQILPWNRVPIDIDRRRAVHLCLPGNLEVVAQEASVGPTIMPQ
jgi:hypothetical protein